MQTVKHEKGKKPKITLNVIEIFLGNLKKDYDIYAPVRKVGAGRLSGTDLVTYGYIESVSEIVFDEKTFFSAKDFMFPLREVMFKSSNGDLIEEKTAIRPAILFLRSCDIHALRILDLMFLKSGGGEDPYYKKRREKIKIFLLECPQAFENCYCVSLGTNTTQDYSVFIRKGVESCAIQIKDQEFAGYFPNIESCEELDNIQPFFSQKDSLTINIPDKIDERIFKHEIWDEYSKRCIACGRCNTSCPTCTCFTVQSIPDADDPGIFYRTRVWSSCQVADFSRLAGNHNFRVDIGQRMRYKVLHKISDFKKRNGFHMCTGCGRCDDVCPEYISMAKSINKMNEAVKIMISEDASIPESLKERV